MKKGLRLTWSVPTVRAKVFLADYTRLYMHRKHVFSPTVKSVHLRTIIPEMSYSLQKLVDGSFCFDPAILHHNNMVGMGERRSPM